MADYGIKISKAGEDVTTATGDDLIFSSSYNTLKISGVYAKSITANNETKTETTAHGLGYKPAFLPFVVARGEFHICPYISLNEDAAVAVDATNIHFVMRNDWVGDLTFDFEVVVFANEMAGI